MKYSVFGMLLLVVMALALASCRSAKKAIGNDDETKASATTAVAQSSKKDKQDVNLAPKTIAAGTNFTSKVKVTITQGDKDITTNGTLRMRYDDVIQIVLIDPFLGVAEVGRLELSPDNVLVIDRLNKRYVSTSYEEFAALKSRNIDFATIQDFFWQEAQSSDKLSYTIPAKKSIKLDLKLSGKGSASDWNAHTTVSGKYTKTDVDRLLGNMIGQ